MKELPNVLDCYNAFHSKGFDIVGVSLDEDAAAWKGAIEKNKLPWHQMSDLAGWKSAAVSVFSFSSIPHTVLIDPKGLIVAKDLRGEELKAKLSELYQ
jgi:peroxiredoxin